MSNRATDHANLNLSEFHKEVIRGISDGKIIWQPRILCWIKDKLFAGEGFPPPFTGMADPDIYWELKCSARIYEYNKCFKPIEHPSITRVKRQLNETDVEITIQTPVGKQVAVRRKTPNSPREIYIKREVSCEEELKVVTWRKENTTWKWNQDAYNAVHQKWDDLGAPTICMPRVNVQDLYINTMGTEKGIYALYDWPDAVEAYFRALDECHDRFIDVVNESPIDIINFGDNVHSGTLPPDLFKKYVMPAYQQRCEKLHSAGKFVHAHWDGDTKPLLPFARETGLDGIEAITPKPQGDVTLEEIKEALGDDIYLIDGIPAIFFDEIYPVSMLEKFTHKIIKLFAPKLILGISDEISSTGDIERIRIVGKIVDDYNASQCVIKNKKGNRR